MGGHRRPSPGRRNGPPVTNVPVSSPPSAGHAPWVEVRVSARALLRGGDAEASEGHQQARLLLRHLFACRGLVTTDDAMLAYAPHDESSDAAVERLRGLIPFLFPGDDTAGVSVRNVAEDDWTGLWHAHFAPYRVGERLVIKPPWGAAWDAAPAGARADDLVLELDPGDAFGTGLHPTTRMCLERLETHVRPGMVIADVGTGSGILAIAAARLGAARVVATEERADAAEVARENAARNGLGDDAVQIVAGTGVPDAADGPFDLVTLNISAPAIRGLAREIAGALRPGGGLLVGSGFVSSHEDAVAGALVAAGLRVRDIARGENGWVCIVAERF